MRGDKMHSQGIQSYGLGFGLRGRLTFWFVLLPMIPTLIIGLICDQLLENGLRMNAERQIKTAITSTQRELDYFFQGMKRHITGLAKQESSLELIETLGGESALGGHTRQSMENNPGRQRFDQWKLSHSLLNVRGYRNTFMADLQGNILVALSDSGIVGQNVFQGPFEDSRLSSACLQVLQEGGVVYSDFDRYRMKGQDAILGHMVTPVIDGERPVGFLVLECDISAINRLLDRHRDLVPSFEMILVGPDGFLRSDSGTRKDRRALIDRRGMNFPHTTESWEAGDYDLLAASYPGPDGVTMFGMHKGFRFGDVQYDLIGEVEERAAFALVERIRAMYWFFSLGQLIFVLTAAYILSGRVVRPVLSMAGWASNVATGDLVLPDFETGDDEMGQFVRNFTQVVVFLRETSSLALSVASGDFNVNIEPRSSRDELGMALAQMTDSLKEASRAMAALAGGDFDVNVTVKGPNDLFAKSINSMVRQIKSTHETNENQARMKSLQMELNETLSGDHSIQELSRRIVSFFCHALGATSGSFYVRDSFAGVFRLNGSFACRNTLPATLIEGQGLPGQAVLEKRWIALDHCPDGFMGIHGITESQDAACLLAYPFIHEDRVVAIMELGLIAGMKGEELEFLDLVSENVAISIMSADSRMKMKELLDKTVKQSEDLKIHQEKLDGINRDLQTKTIHLQETEAQLRKQEAELRAANRDLTDQAQKLKKSEKRLKVKEGELTEANAALEERSLNLEEQKNAIKQKNLQLEATQKELVEKSRRLENSSRYKSEFLANMSHELRTPLNSILLISRLMSENKAGNLSDKQVEFARTILSSGRDLLTLIDDILDLSKIESGKLELQVSRTLVSEMAEKIVAGFSPVCQDKGIGFDVIVDPQLPECVHVDFQRTDQVIKNLVGNAIKFTSHGRVTVNIGFPDKLPRSLENRYKRDSVLMISVTDTGVGIPKEKISAIFDAFKQADGTISRQFGGTGLGLSISKQLILLMGGDIDVESRAGHGSVFNLYIPDVFHGVSSDEGTAAGGLFIPEDTSGDHEPPMSRKTILSEPGRSPENETAFTGKKLLIADDDMRNVFALIHYLEEFGMEILVAKSGKQCLEVLDKHPDMDLVIMDIMMPEMDGFEAMEKIRAQERFMETPIISLTAKAMKGDREKCLDAGASDYLSKPVDMDLLIRMMKTAMGR